MEHLGQTSVSDTSDDAGNGILLQRFPITINHMRGFERPFS
jgi:hypothetical protein